MIFAVINEQLAPASALKRPHEVVYSWIHDRYALFVEFHANKEISVEHDVEFTFVEKLIIVNVPIIYCN